MILAEMNNSEKAYALLILGIGAVFIVVLAAWVIHAMSMAFRKKNKKSSSHGEQPDAWKEAANRIDASEVPEDPEELIK